jgi:hypothetical protein
MIDINNKKLNDYKLWEYFNGFVVFLVKKQIEYIEVNQVLRLSKTINYEKHISLLILSFFFITVLKAQERKKRYAFFCR